jgi:hypothetical protein
LNKATFLIRELLFYKGVAWMRKISCIILMLVFVVLVNSGAAQEQTEKKDEFPPGMEVIQIKGAKFVVPKGTKVYKKGDLVILEAAHEYVARKVSELEERLLRMEAREEELGQKFEQLDKTVSEMQKNILVAQGNEGRSELLDLQSNKSR